MKRYQMTRQESEIYLCDVCNNEIPESEVILMRESAALPEEPTYHVHKRCADRFPKKQQGNWHQIHVRSIDAGWLL